MSGMRGFCRYVRESKAVQKISGYADSSACDHAPDELSKPSDGTGATIFLCEPAIITFPRAHLPLRNAATALPVTSDLQCLSGILHWPLLDR